MNRTLRHLAWSLLSLCLVAVGCGDAPEESVPATPEGRPDRVVQDFVLLETDEGRPDWKLTSDTAEYFKTPSETHLKGVYLEFYEPDGSVRSWLTSDQGTVSEGSGDMTAVGNVVLVSAKGDTLRTEELYFARVQELITGPGFVRIAKPDRVLTGIGFRAKPDLSEYEVERDVHLTLIDRSGGQVIDQ